MIIKEPKKLAAIFLIVYIIISVCLLIDSFTSKNHFPKITGGATGRVSIVILNITNVTACTPPAKPVLNHVKDSFNNDITMSWTSFKIGAEYDQFVIDSKAPVTADSPQKRYLTLGTHTWAVRTCSASCCSDYATDTFRVLRITHPVVTTKEVVSPPQAPSAPLIRIPSPVQFQGISNNLLITFYLIGVLILTFTLTIILLKNNAQERVDIKKRKKIEEYINTALNEGFTETQIRNKLNESGFTNSAIDSAFKKLK